MSSLLSSVPVAVYKLLQEQGCIFHLCIPMPAPVPGASKMLSGLGVLLYTCCISQDSAENAIMEAEKFQELHPATCRLRRADGIVVAQVQGHEN